MIELVGNSVEDIPVDKRNISGITGKISEKWINDPERCKKAGVPVEHQVFKTKLELALEMVDSAVSENVEFGWIAADAFYGRDSKLLNTLDDSHLTFLADVPCNQNVYLSDPRPL